MKRFLSVFAMLMVSVAIFAKGEIKTIVYTTTPVMHCENCENKIKGNLKFIKGIKSIVTSVENQTVTITYNDAKTTPEKIEAGFKKIGYTVKVVDGKTACSKPMCGGCKKAEGKEAKSGGCCGGCKTSACGEKAKNK